MQEATVTMYLRQAWNDPRLQSEDEEALQSRRIPRWEHVWVPDTFFRYDLGSFVHEQTVPNRLMRLEKNGDIWYVMK